jgi:hypothetical protein
VSALDIEENKTLLDQAKLAKNGLLKLHKSMVEPQRSSQMEDLEITTFAETLMVSQRPFGATPLIQRRDGSIVIQLQRLKTTKLLVAKCLKRILISHQKMPKLVLK